MILPNKSCETCENEEIKEFTPPKNHDWEFPVRLFYCAEHYPKKKPDVVN